MSPHDNDGDEELQGCFKGMCLPHRDPLRISAQVLSILGFILSFTWWVNLAFGLVSLVGFQCMWCRRPSKWSLVFALAAATAALYSGIHSNYFPDDDYECNAFIFYRGYGFSRYCKHLVVVALLDSALWMATAGCMIAFHATGRDNVSNDNNDNEDDIGPRCMCLPYRDPLMISAQVLSILAFLLTLSWFVILNFSPASHLSFTWWVIMAFGLMSLVGFQCVWCRRSSKGFLRAALIFALVAAAAALYSGIERFLKPGRHWCNAHIVDPSYDSHWVCTHLIAVSFVDAVLWMATAGCAIAFHVTGRYSKWEAHLIDQHHNENNETNTASENTRDKDAARPESARPVAPTKTAGSNQPAGLEDKRGMDEDEETEITTTTTINDVAFAPREMMEQMMDDDSDDEETEITTPTTINDVAFAPREMIEQIMHDDSDDDDYDEDFDEEKAQISKEAQKIEAEAPIIVTMTKNDKN